MPPIVPVLIIVGVVGIGYYLMTQQSEGGDAMPNQTGETYYNSDGSVTGAPITNDSSTWPASDAYWQMCCAIAKAEGYQKGAGYIPYDYNNPGDITDDASDYGSGTNGITTFPTAEVGWQALYTKISNICNGRSSAYPKDWDWTQVGTQWAGGDQNWATNVCNALNVDPSTTPASFAGV
jgi:hypothetical protein